MDVQPNPPREGATGNDLTSIPGSLEAYIATRSVEPGQTVVRLVREYARTALWKLITGPDESALNMLPCRIGANLLLRRLDGNVTAAIVRENWTITMVGDEVWLDLVATDALALAYIGAPIETAFQVPFLSPELKVRASKKMGKFYRFCCYA
jgi:hypothetical protein